MRLTLRTMLAYLDDVLSEADAHELGQKIESSDFATGLVHRIRNSISRLRLSSPDMLGSDSMDDPNSVAEFIDSSLAPEKEQEFEKVCLQSDKHLAEVASCHQILTLVLGTPARVEPRLRDRIYRSGIPGDGAVTTAPLAAAETREPFRRLDLTAADVAASDEPVEIKRPRDLGDSRPSFAEFAAKHLWPIVAAVMLGFLLISGAMVVLGPLDGSHPLAGLLGLRDDDVAKNADLPEQIPATDPQLPPAPIHIEAAPMRPESQPTLQFEQPIDDSPHQNNVVEPYAAPAAQPATDWVIPGEPSGSPLATEDPEVALDRGNKDGAGTSPESVDLGTLDPFPVASDSTHLDTSPLDAVVAEPDIRDPFARDTDNGPPDAAIADVVPLEIEPNEPPMPDREISLPGLDATPRDLVSDAAVLPADVGPDVDPGIPQVVESEGSETVDAIEQIVEVGRCLSEDEVLLFWDEQTSAWLRVPPRTAFVVGDRIRTLEVFRPQLLLAPSNIQVTSRGNSEIVFAEPIDAQTPKLEVPFGRFLMNSTGQPNSRIALQTGQRLVVIDFTEPDSEVVCQVRPVLLPGLDPRQEAPHRMMQLWVTRGSVKIIEQEMEQQVDVGSQYAFADDMASRIVRFQEVPGWLHIRVGEVDRDAANELEALLPTKRDVVLSLSEAADGRRTDVRSLAIRYLVALEQYRVGAALFSIPDRKHQFTWPLLFDELRAAIARGPKSASAVYQTFERLYGVDGGKLYRMLLGFDNEQLKEGAAEQLVDDLDNPRVEFRILAFENLKQMTKKTYMYGPIQSEKNRSSKITKWRSELKKGKVTVSNPSEDLVEWHRLTAPVGP